MSKEQGASKDVPTETPWQTTDEAASEWTPDNVVDLSEGTLLTTGACTPFKRTLKIEEDDGTTKQVDKYYVHAKIGKEILPIRVNKFSLGELEKGFGKVLDEWHGKPVVFVVDTSKKWPFIVIKPKPGLAGKGKARRKA